MPTAIIGLISAAGVSGLVTATGGLTLLGGLLSVGLSLGLNLGLQALFGPKAPKPQDVKNVIRQSVPVRRKGYGIIRIGGKLLAIETINGDLWQVIYLQQGPINAYLMFYIDDRTAWPLSPEGYVLAGPWQDMDGAYSFAHIHTRLGTEDQTAFQEFIDATPEGWGANFRARGCAVAILRTNGCKTERFPRLYPNRISTFNAEVEAATLYDPRVDDKLFRNPATPGYVPGQNLALITLDYLSDPDGAQIDRKYIDLDDFTDEANRADEIIPTKGGGSTHRYYGQFVYELDSEPGDNVRRLTTATGGRLYLKPSGKIGFMTGRWIEPTVHIYDADIFDFEIDDRLPPNSDGNEIVIKYTNPLSRYSETPSDPWRNEADISRIGQVRSVAIDAFEIQNHNHARRIAKMEAARRNPRWIGVIRTNLVGMRAWDQRFIRVTIEDLDIDGETFEVLDVGMAGNEEDLSVMLKISSMTAEAFAFDPETEEGTAPVNPEDLEQDATPTPINYEAHCEQRTIGRQSVAVLVATWEYEQERGDVEPEAQYSIADADDWRDMAVGSDYPFSAESPIVKDKTLFDVRMRFNLASASPGPWVVVENVMSVADIVAPPKPEETIAAANGAGLVTASCRAGSEPDNTARIRFYRRPNGQAWNIDTATLVRSAPAEAEDTRSTKESPGSGTWIYDFVAVNGSGVVGERADDSRTVTIP